MSVKTNIGRKFINLVKKHFTTDNPLTRIFNKNNMRVSYSCMPNLETIVKSHNQAILKNKTDEVLKCNCRSKCILKDQKFSCRTKDVLYKATVISKNSKKYYIGLSATEFKARYSNHKSSFKNIGKRNSTVLAKYVWELKEKNVDFEIEWEILKRAKSIKSGDRTCRLCLKEATLIVFADNECLNKRREVVSTCRHAKKLLLESNW